MKRICALALLALSLNCKAEGPCAIKLGRAQAQDDRAKVVSDYWQSKKEYIYSHFEPLEDRVKRKDAAEADKLAFRNYLMLGAVYWHLKRPINELGWSKPIERFKDYSTSQIQIVTDLLIALSYSAQGRELIDRVIPMMLGHEKLAIDFYFNRSSLTLGSCGRPSEEDSRPFLSVRVQANLPLHQALVIFAHELFHAYDIGVREIDKGLSSNNGSVLLEARAYRFQQKVLVDLLSALPGFATAALANTEQTFILHLQPNELIYYLRRDYKLNVDQPIPWNLPLF